MTDEASVTMVVTQADRDAAVNTAREHLLWKAHYRMAVRNGQKDGNWLVQAFARHRVSSIEAATPFIEARVLERAIEAVRDRCGLLKWAGKTPTIADAEEAIRNLAQKGRA